MKHERIIHETESGEEAEALWQSREWCMPRWSESKRKYIMIRKKSSIKESV